MKATAMLSAAGAHTSQKRERNQRIDKLLCGLSGNQIRKLLGPLLRRKLRQLRQRKEIRAHPELTAADFSSLADFCVANSVLGVLGREIVLRLLKGASVEAVLAADFLCYQGEPSFSANMQIVFAGSAVVRHRTQDTNIHMPTGGLVDSRTFRYEFVPVGEQLSAPFLCGCLSALIDATSPYSVLATTPLLFLNVKASAVAEELRNCDAKVIERLRGTIVEHRLAFFSSRYTPAPLILRHGWMTTVLMLLTNQKRTPSITPLQALQSRLAARCYLPGEPLVTKGKPFSGIIFLWRGEAEFSDSRGPDQQQVRLLPLTIIGERSVCLGYKSKHTIIAKTTCDAWVLPLTEFEFLKGFVHGFREKVESVAISIQQQLLMNKRAREETCAAIAQVAVRMGEAAPLVERGVSDERHPLLFSLVTALRGVEYLREAPNELLLELASSAKAVVNLPQTALLTRSRWSGQLLVLTKGAATVQLGLTPTTSDLATTVLSRGSVIGAECIIEHRWVVSVCSVSVVETWCISRDVLREKLRRYNLLEVAELWSRRHILSLFAMLSCDPPNYLSHPQSCKGPPAGPTRSTRATAVADAESMSMPSAEQQNQTSTSVQKPSTAAEGPALSSNTAGIGHGKPYVFHDLSGDLNFGLVDSNLAIRLLCSAPTADHVKFASLFPEVMVMVKDCGNSGVRLLESPPLVQVQSLNEIEPVMSILCGTQGDAGLMPFDSQIVKFVPGRTMPRSESVMDALAEERLENQRNDTSSYMLVHKRPTTLFVAEMGELVGDRVPWHVLLLERKCLIPGYLEGSEPLQGTTVVRKKMAPRPFASRNATREGGKSQEPHPPKRLTNGQHHFHPINPHSYACILPKSVENPRRKQREQLHAPDQLDPDMLKTIIESNQDVVRAFYRNASAPPSQQVPQVEVEPVVDFDEIFLAEVHKTNRSQSVMYEASLASANQRLIRGAVKGMNTASARNALQAHNAPLSSPSEKGLPPTAEDEPLEGSAPRHIAGSSKRSHFLEEYERFLFSAQRGDAGGDGSVPQHHQKQLATPRIGHTPKKVWRPNSCGHYRLACTTSVHEIITANQKGHGTHSSLVLPPAKPPVGVAAKEKSIKI